MFPSMLWWVFCFFVVVVFFWRGGGVLFMDFSSFTCIPLPEPGRVSEVKVGGGNRRGGRSIMHG